MKKKIVDIRTSVNGEICDTLCVNNATTAQLNAVLALVSAGSEILLIVREQEIPDFLLNTENDEK